MRSLVACALLLIPVGCNTYHPQASQLGAPARPASLATIAPVPARLSSPAVATDRSVLDYAEDLDRCRARVSARMGGGETDDVAALRRTLRNGPLAGTVAVDYAATDPAVSQDKLVKDCLSTRGYLVAR